MAGSIELKLEEYNNDDDAIKALETVTEELEDIPELLAEKEYDQASADLDDQINKLQGIKNYIDTLVEGKE